MNTTFINCTNHGRQKARKVEVEVAQYNAFSGARWTVKHTKVQTLPNGFVKCSVCNYPGPAIVIDATITDTPCSEKCVTATSKKCECACGGENHGA